MIYRGSLHRAVTFHGVAALPFTIRGIPCHTIDRNHAHGAWNVSPALPNRPALPWKAGLAC